MYMLLPGNTVQALDATNGKLIWEHKRPSGSSRAKTIAIYDDMVFNSTPDGFIEALDARTGELRWETKSSGRLTSGVIVVEGKVLTGRACAPKREDCYISAHDAKTGKEVWRFYTAAASNEPGGETWAGAPDETRAASSWALPGGYDPVRRLVYWGVANPTPNTRANRHGGKSNAIPTESPADLYSNSTIALDPDTGKLRWYYQHLPGDDWDEDYANERTLLRTTFNPDPKLVKWFNPDVKRGEQRDVAVMVGEGGGIFVIDRGNGQFLWANPFPFDTPDFLIANVDGKTGRVSLNKNKLFTGPSDRRVICYWNTRSYWPTAYHPGVNSLVRPLRRELPRHDIGGTEQESRASVARGIPRPGSDSQLVGWPHEDRHGDGRDETDLHRSRAEQRCGADDGWQRRVLGRSRSEVPGLRRAERQDAVGADARWSGAEQHDHLLGGWEAVHCRPHRQRRALGCADGSGWNQAESRIQRVVRVCVTLTLVNSQNPDSQLPNVG